MKKDWKYIAPLGIILILFVLYEAYKPTPIDWRATYSKEDKIPFGSFLLFQVLEDIFPKQKIEPVYKSIFETLSKERNTKANYFFISSSFSPGEADLNKLLAFVEKGNTAFIASSSFGGEFADSLNIEITDAAFDFIDSNDSTQIPYNDSLGLNFVAPGLETPKPYTFKKGAASTYFSSFDTVNSSVLGINERNNPTYIKVTFGKGVLFLSSTPLAFTNFNVVYDANAEYISKALSYLPNQTILWDEYYKGIKKLSQTPLRFILSEESLKWAYFMALLSLLLFMIFEAKRRQRIIPEAEPLTNTTLDFVESVGRLYLHNEDHKVIADKRISYFWEYLRNRFYIRTSNSTELMEILPMKLGVDKEEVKALLDFINYIKSTSYIPQEDLIELNNLIQNFYKKIK